MHLTLSPHAVPVINAMSVDVEDYFQVSAFETEVPADTWDGFESRVCRNTRRLLELLGGAGVSATFFVLGWVAERHPRLVREISEAGHEIASHGYGHRLVYSQSPAEFRSDIRRAKIAIENAAGTAVLGYRAPSYSITRKSLWALDVLIEEGYVYDTSVYPIHHDRYGIPDAPRHAHRVNRSSGSIWEVPGSTVRIGRLNLPIGGGGYFRMLPYAWTRWGFSRLNTIERRPGVFYLHPWEIDPDQPRISASLLRCFRHYYNLSHTERRLVRLLRDFRFGRVCDIIGPGPLSVHEEEREKESLAVPIAADMARVQPTSDAGGAA
jgi:polysaccharide deacetylase family protein (PEP-CTERM system associated)